MPAKKSTRKGAKKTKKRNPPLTLAQLKRTYTIDKITKAKRPGEKNFRYRMYGIRKSDKRPMTFSISEANAKALGGITAQKSAPAKKGTKKATGTRRVKKDPHMLPSGKRCEAGYHKNPKTGVCEKAKQKKVEVKVSVTEVGAKTKKAPAKKRTTAKKAPAKKRVSTLNKRTHMYASGRCERGYNKDKKTGKCVKRK